MSGIGTVLDVMVIVLLSATMLHAVRLHRALEALRQDRGALERAAAGFDDGARIVEGGLARLRQAAEQLGGQLEQAGSLRDDLSYLADRGEGVADRLDGLVRQGRPMVVDPALAVAPARSQAETDLLAALQGRR